MVIKLSNTLRADEEELQLICEEDFKPLMLSDETTWKI
jgi:hypothetical protein